MRTVWHTLPGRWMSTASSASMDLMMSSQGRSSAVDIARSLDKVSMSGEIFRIT